MITLNEKQIRDIIKYIVNTLESKEQYDDLSPKLFGILGDDAKGTGFKAQLLRLLENLKWNHGLSEDELIELAKRINYGPIYHAVARRISPAKRQQHFPEIAKKFENAPVMTSNPVSPPGVGTTTAQVAKIPVPIGPAKFKAATKKKK